MNVAVLIGSRRTISFVDGYEITHIRNTCSSHNVSSLARVIVSAVIPRS